MKGSDQKKYRIILIPPVYFIAGIFIIILIYFFLPQFNLISWPYNLAGVALVLIGSYLIIAPSYILKKHQTPEKFEKSTTVVTSSLYSFSRNPMYLGGVAFLIGLAILLTNVLALIIPLAFFMIMNQVFIPYEEQRITKEQGQKYADYKNKVRRWL